MKPRLLDTPPERAAKAKTSTALVPLPSHACLACGGPVREAEVSQPALLRHGGYGHTAVNVTLDCMDPECATRRRWASLSRRPDRR